ncbi:DNA/RNA polymerases superfamily protein [Gossypium australe]|uniref:DNA/RNA polymerases superfamily protein n=1 Tax=Gossypium australe TaxID=47621 RepID=A0A5B6VMW4_9ROSI|nr:DNA/RNA polymerases superfamily protein [Gossypium australe]
MDFVSGLPLTPSKKDSVWVIVDRLTKSAHFIPVRVDYSLQKLAKLYVSEIVRLHGVPVSIISDRDPRFTSRFWRALHQALGTRLDFSTAFHPQSYGQSERVIQILEDMLRGCVLDFRGSWEEFLPLAEFAYNNSYQASIKMAPYEALYGRKCHSPTCWTELSERQVLGPELVAETEDKVKLIQARLKEASDRQKSYADLRWRDIEFDVGDRVFLKVSPWKKVLRFGRKGKLSPRFIGPYKVLRRVGPVAYQLELPAELSQIHDVFHVSMLRRYRSDPSHVVAVEEIEVNSDLTTEEEPVQILDRDVKVLRKNSVPLVKVLWRNHGMEEATWEPEDVIRQGRRSQVRTAEIPPFAFYFDAKEGEELCAVQTLPMVRSISGKWPNFELLMGGVAGFGKGVADCKGENHRIVRDLVGNQIGSKYGMMMGDMRGGGSDIRVFGTPEVCCVIREKDYALSLCDSPSLLSFQVTLRSRKRSQVDSRWPCYE